MDFFEYIAEKFGLPRLANCSPTLVSPPPGQIFSAADWDARFTAERAIGHRQIGLFLGFTQAEVDSTARQWKVAQDVIARGIRDVGMHNRMGLSNYEKLFGKYGLASGAGYAARKDFVLHTLQTMSSDMAQNRWYITKDVSRGALASAKGGRGGFSLSLGEIKNMAHVGFLIHEVAHNAGMEDVCEAETCSKKLFALDRHDIYPNSIKNSPPECKINATHGGLATGGHFIGWKRASLLAKTSKNLSVWNADSYRWYCLLFFKSEADAAFQESFNKTPAW